MAIAEHLVLYIKRNFEYGLQAKFPLGKQQSLTLHYYVTSIILLNLFRNLDILVNNSKLYKLKHLIVIFIFYFKLRQSKYVAY